MANPEHVKILEQGTSGWLRWRENNPDVPLDLSGLDFYRIQLRYMDHKVTGGVGLYEFKMKFPFIDFRFANLSGADLSDYEFSDTDFYGANLRGAHLVNTYFHGVDFRNANIEGATCGFTTFANVDLSSCRGLAQVNHYGLSHLSMDTILRSKNNLPIAFLRGCGISDQIIDLIPSLVQASSPYYSCQLVYHMDDQAFVQRLHDRLQSAGVRCWLYGRYKGPGSKRRQSDSMTLYKSYDQLVYCCSKSFFNGEWLHYNNLGRSSVIQGKSESYRINLDVDGCLAGQAGYDSYKVSSEKQEVLPYQDWNNPDNFEAMVQSLVQLLRIDVGDSSLSEQK